MQVNSIARPNVTGASAPAVTNQASSAATNYNSFLQLLIAEMRNQDPTKPMDPTQTVSQLATFSLVQQSAQTNSLLSAMSEGSSLAEASALIGRTVTPSDGSASGVISSVTLSNGALIATYTDGRNAPLASDMTLS